jgi:hypothetical protein
MEVKILNKNWKSVERVRWKPDEDQFLLEKIKFHIEETHMDLARKIINNPIVEGRTLDAIEQRIGWMRANLKTSKKNFF